MTAPNSILYTAEVDFLPQDQRSYADWLEWYAFRHVADLFQAGFKSCASYRAVQGGMTVFDIYDLDSADVFETAFYRDMASRDPYDAAMMRPAVREAATVYKQRVIAPADAAGAIPLLNADWLAVLRFEAAPSEDASLTAWLESVEGPRVMGLGASRVRFACRSSNHPKVPTHRPRCLTLVEWPEQPAAHALGADPLKKRFGDAVKNIDLYVGQRAYPWPNKPRSEYTTFGADEAEP
jgi:hypothetical protein